MAVPGPITFPAFHNPRGQKLIIGMEETTAGTASTGLALTGGLPLIQQPFKSVDWSPQIEEYVAEENMGAMADAVTDESMTHYDQVTVNVPLQAGGFGMWALASLMGIQLDAVTGSAAPYTHAMVLAPLTTRCPTFSMWYQPASLEGAAASSMTLQWLRSTVTSVHLTWAPNTDVNAEIVLWCQWPTIVAPPTPDVYVGGTDTAGAEVAWLDRRMMGTKGTFHLYGSGGSLYAAKVLSGDITFSRPIETNFHTEAPDLQDLAPGVLSFSGTLNFTFDGYDAGKVAADFYNFVPGGSATNPNSFKWTDADAHSIAITAYPMQFNTFTIDRSAQYAKGNAGFRTYSKMTEANQATPTLSTVKSLQIINAIAQPLLHL